MIYRFRIILDNETEEDIFRDLEIRKTDTLEDLHNIITQSFGFDGSEMASFYISNDDWEQGEEISLYVYDFLSMWTFYVELAEIVDVMEGTDYPNLMFVQGQVPDTAPEKLFKAEEFNEYNEFEDSIDVEDYDSLGFEENWN